MIFHEIVLIFCVSFLHYYKSNRYLNQHLLNFPKITKKNGRKTMRTGEMLNACVLH